MTHMTAEQKDALVHLSDQYGAPDRVAIEYTDAPYGVALFVWYKQPVFRIDERWILVRPNGKRLTWRTLQYRGEKVST